ncbi:hypothetical protein QCA50_013489 [Cerrena zonata]|uniref:Uncharacterized protein n=1 Tax=Cerrena zonata TaxID=2478898 RepID=A0AAW0FSZ7_9APHY
MIDIDIEMNGVRPPVLCFVFSFECVRASYVPTICANASLYTDELRIPPGNSVTSLTAFVACPVDVVFSIRRDLTASKNLQTELIPGWCFEIQTVAIDVDEFSYSARTNCLQTSKTVKAAHLG